MNAKKVIFAVMSVLLALMLLLTGIVIGRVLDLFQGASDPVPSTQGTTDPTKSQTEPTAPPTTVPTVPTVPPTTVPTVPTVPPTTVPTEPGHVHDWKLTESVVATCENYGYKIYTCTGCGKQDIPFDEQENPLGHSFGPGMSVAATCTDEGYTQYTCSVCKKTDNRNYKSALGHDFQLKESVEAGCENAGYDLYVCSRCGLEESRNETAAIGHDYVLTESNCASALYICSVCGGQKTEGSGAAEHNYVHFRVLQEATCTEDGLQELYCLNCSTYTTEVIPATGHNFEPEGELTPPSCTEDNVQDMTCTVCGEKRTEVIPAEGHSYWPVREEAPSCITNGFRLYKCTVCGDEYEESIPATGHTYMEWIPSDNGGIERSCGICDLVQTSEDLKITNVQVSVDGENDRIYMIYVGTDTEPSMFYYMITDHLNNGTLAYALGQGESKGLVITYTNAAGEPMEIVHAYLETDTIVIPAE